jgi:glutamyl-tRNA reductase
MLRRDWTTLGPELHKMFLAAVRAGKRARSETAIGQGAFSIGRCAVDTAKAALGSLEGRTVLILGAGKIAQSAARHLLSQGAETILVANRTFSRAHEFAQELGGRALRYDQLPGGLVEADIVITSTAAPHFVLLPEHVEAAMAQRIGKELFLVDIAVPRDVDPAVEGIPGVHLCDIDHLNGGVQSAEEDRAEAIADAEGVACECAEEFCRWLAAREAAPLLTSLRERCEEARQEVLSRFSGKVERLSPADRDLLERVTASLVKRLMHGPTVNLKRELALGNGKVADLLERMYGLGSASQEAAQSSERTPAPKDELALELLGPIALEAVETDGDTEPSPGPAADSPGPRNGADA